MFLIAGCLQEAVDPKETASVRWYLWGKITGLDSQRVQGFSTKLQREQFMVPHPLVLPILFATRVGFCHGMCLQGPLGAQAVLNELQERAFLNYFLRKALPPLGLCHITRLPEEVPQKEHQKLPLTRQTPDTRSSGWDIFLGTVLSSAVCYCS